MLFVTDSIKLFVGCKFRETLSVSKQAAQKFDVKIFISKSYASWKLRNSIRLIPQTVCKFEKKNC
jgi:hypothetical protein